MKAVQVQAPVTAALVDVPDLTKPSENEILLRVDLVGMCGTDLTTFRGGNPMVAFPRILGHEVAATIVEGAADLPAGTKVTVSPYTHCGVCASCRRGRFNACQNNHTMGVQRDGAMTEYISLPREKLYTANLSSRELCLVEPLTVGAHAAARGRITPEDTVAVFGCGGIGLGAIASAAFREATTIAIDMDDHKLEIARKAGAAHLINTATQDLHIGYTKEPVSYETRLFVQKELDILGSRNALPEDFRAVIRMLESGKFPVEDAVSAIVPPEEAANMLAEWSAKPGKFTKIMVQFAD